MIFFAWSLVLSAVNFARRQRLTSILERHLYSSYSCHTGLCCQQIQKQLFGKLLTVDDDSGVDSSSSSNGTLIRAPSEPAISQRTSTIVLYRTEELEIIAVPKPEPLQITNWTLFTDDLRRKPVFISANAPRISFIAVIDVNKNYQNEEDLNKIIPIDESSNFESGENSDELKNEATTGVPSALLSSLANQIAFKRHKPNEVLYETDLDNFYSIVFHWSESSLFEFSGRGIVKEIYTVQLPDLTQKTDNLLSSVSTSLSYASTGALTLPSNLNPRKPFTLLEYLYLKDLFGDVFDISNEWKTLNVIHKMDEYAFYRSDSALNRAISPPYSEFSGFKRKNFPTLPSTNPSSTRSSYTPSSIPDSSDYQIPAYIKELRKQNSLKTDRRRTSSLNNNVHSNRNSENHYFSPSVTLDNFLEDIKYIDCSSIEEESTSTTATPKDTITQNISSSEIPSTVRNSNKKIQKNLEEFILNNGNKKKSNGNPIRVYPPPKTSSYPVKEIKRKISTTYKFTKMTETLAKKFHLNVNVISHEISTGAYCRKRFASLVPGGNIAQQLERHDNEIAHGRRRSLSPLTLSIVANYVNHEPTTLANTAAIGAKSRLTANEHFIRRRSVTPTRRRFHSISNKTSDDANDGREPKPPQKPPTILVYTADDSHLFKRIFDSLYKILPKDVYTIFNLSNRSLINDPWVDENAVCVILADTKSLGDLGWSRLQSYFIHSGKILFLCQNSLLANLTSCNSTKKQANLLKSAFGNKNASLSLGKDFEVFLKKSMKDLTKNKEVCETFHAKDLVGGYKYSVVIQKKKDTPLLLYMENSQNNASALFSDATADELLTDGGESLIADAMKRLKIQLIENQNIPGLTRGYFMCEPDRLTWNMKGLSYGENIGSIPKLHFQSENNILQHPDMFPRPNSTFLPIEVRRRKSKFAENIKFDTEKYFSNLTTKSLGKALLFVPVCETTMTISRSLFSTMPQFDGILVVAGIQTNGSGRSGNQWLSPEGCAMFTFNFNIPLNSILGQSASFVQHILAVSIVDAVITILKMPEFGLKIKWPNDLYFNRLFKMGGILVTSSLFGDLLQCVIGAGLNVANSKPTVCLNDMLPEDCDKILTIEEVVAETMNKFEYYVHLFENSGKEAFLKRYYEFWLHTREEVTVEIGDTGIKEKVIIRGLDTYGYLEVRCTQTGKVFSVHDNGNTFDMMKGLIRPKRR